MGAYVMKVRMGSFLAGAATASFIGLYLIHNDHKTAQDSISQQMKGLHESLDERVSTLEKLRDNEVSNHAVATE